jgi:nucleotide-binding universal stress UspA family protein
MKILFATDGSPYAEHAIDEALKFVIAEDMDAYVVGVARSLLMMATLEVSSSGLARLPAQERLARDIGIARAQAQLARRGITAGPIACEGDPGHEILAVAQRLRPDLLVLGSHGRGALGRLVLGSVSDKVAHGWDGALMVVRPSPGLVGEPVGSPLFCSVCGTELSYGGLGYSGYEYSCASCQAAFHIEGEFATFVTPTFIDHGEKPVVVALERLRHRDGVMHTSDRSQ